MKINFICESNRNKKHIARIAGHEYQIGFQEAKRVASSLGATRFEYDGSVFVFVNGRWKLQSAPQSY